MRAARYCFTAVRLLVVGDSVRPGRGDGMEQVIYASSGHGSPRFFVKVRETAQRIWLRRIGERMVDGDWMYGHCVPDPEAYVENGSDVQMMKRNGYLWNAKERLYAEVWDGKPETVYCD